MYIRLLKAVKKILIHELKDSFRRNPAYDKVFISGKFPHKKKRKFELVVKVSSGSEIMLSGDHYMGIKHSFCTLASVKDKPSTSIEWIREMENVDTWAEPAYYYIEIINDHQFMVDPLYPGNEVLVESAGNYIQSGCIVSQKSSWEIEWTSGVAYLNAIRHDIDAGDLELPHEEGIWYVFINTTGIVDFAEYEPEGYHANMAIVTTDATGITGIVANNLDESWMKLSRDNVLPGSEKVFKNDVAKAKGTFYNIDYTNGEVTLLESLSKGDRVYITYRSIGVSTGPWEYEPETYNYKAIPGVVIAFGSSPVMRDKHVIIVEAERKWASHIYSGTWDLAISIDIIASDVSQEEELVDTTIAYLALKKPLLDQLGLAIESLSISGEGEDEEYATIQELRYYNGIDATIKSQWMIMVPILKRIETIIYSDPDDNPLWTDSEAALLEKYPIPSLEEPEPLDFEFQGEKIT